MIKTGLRLIKSPPSADKLAKQLDYGTAVGMTKTAKQAQTAIVTATKSGFTTRGSWFQQNNKFGIRVKTAKPTDLTAAIQTNADWLQKQKEGGHIPASKDVRTFHITYAGKRYIAVPTPELRPHGSTKVLSKSLWPSTLQKRKGAFVIKSRKTGTLVLMVRFAGGKDGYTPMYILIPDEQIKPKDTFFEPAQQTVDKNLGPNIADAIEQAFKTAK